MKLLLDYVPIAVFFAVYVYSKDLILATIVLIPATAIQILLAWRIFGKVEKMYWITFTVLLVMGGFTIAFNDPLFIQWKPTLAYSLMALALTINLLWARKPFIENWLGKHVQLAAPHWRRISWAWVAFFLFSATLNVIIVYNFSEAFWVHYKLYGQLLVTLAFLLLQGAYVYKNQLPEQA